MFGSLEFIIVIAVARLLSVSSRGRFNRLARSRDIPQASTPKQPSWNHNSDHYHNKAL